MASPLFVKLDVTWVDHPDLVALGLQARGLHAVALCLAKRLETNGWVDRVLLHREGATDELIDTLVAAELLEADALRVRPSGWHDRNPSQGAIDATRTAKADAAKRGNHARWNHPGPLASCPICNPESPGQSHQRSQADRKGIAYPSPETETETETTSLLKSENHSDSDPGHAGGGDDEPAAPTIDEQAIRRTAVLIGRAVTGTQAGITNPDAYAAKVTRGILDTDGDGIDRDRIERLLGSGRTPEQIAQGWAVGADPFGLGPAGPRVPEPPRPSLNRPECADPECAGGMVLDADGNARRCRRCNSGLALVAEVSAS